MRGQHTFYKKLDRGSVSHIQIEFVVEMDLGL